MDPVPDPDAPVRAAAFAEARRLEAVHGGLIPSHALREGFVVEGRRFAFITPQRGIFRPAGMRHLLSIRTVVPRTPERLRYADQSGVLEGLRGGAESFEYAFMGKDPDARENRGLREARDLEIPLLYFLGVAPALYQLLAPVFVTDWDPHGCRCRIIIGSEHTRLRPPAGADERRYALRLARQRLHQNVFRVAVLDAYGHRCAMSGLPEATLLEAAHILPDADPERGQPVVPNGIALSALHHAAFDRHLLGIDPDGRIHVARHLLALDDGPTLEAMKALHGRRLRLPARAASRPDRDRRAERFRVFVDTDRNT